MSNRNENKITAILAKIQRDIEEIKKTMKLFLLQSGRKVGEELTKILDTPQKKIAYQLTDGVHSAHEISGIVGVSITSINRWWREWQRVGIVTRVKEKRRTRTQKNFSLEDMGVDVPDVSSLRSDQFEIGQIPNEEKLRIMLKDSSMFKNSVDLSGFGEKIFNRTFIWDNREDLIKDIVDSFYGSSKRTQMMFIQALRQRAKREESRFRDYFDSWEKHIKSEI